MKKLSVTVVVIGEGITEKYFFIKNSLHNLLESQGGSLSKAIEASERSIENRDEMNPHSSYTEVGLLIKKLLSSGKMAN